MYQPRDIADYYNQTQHHYERWWKLRSNRAVHYGFWNENTRNFNEALQQTNIEMAKLAGIQTGDRVLDAGCGVGGAALYLSSKLGAHVEGITLSEKQLTSAQELLNLYQSLPIHFSLQNYTKTDFPTESFDVIWACESSCYANPKTDFLLEANRLLKKGGRLIVADYFTTGKDDKHPYLKKWADLWAIEQLHSQANFLDPLVSCGFELQENNDVSLNILLSAKRMYRAALAGALPSEVYNFFHSTSRFGKKHYLSGYYQYKALKLGLWTYRFVLAIKK